MAMVGSTRLGTTEVHFHGGKQGQNQLLLWDHQWRPKLEEPSCMRGHDSTRHPSKKSPQHIGIILVWVQEVMEEIYTTTITEWDLIKE